MKKSIASVCLSGDLRQKIDAAARAGFEGMEIFENDLMLFNEPPGVVKRMAEDSNLKIIALQPFRDFECMPAKKMQKNFDRAERKFDLMAELGTDTLLICSNVSGHCIDNVNRAMEDFTELAERADSRNYRIGYEALAWGKYVRDYEDAWNLVNRVDRANFGIVLDSFHIFARNRSLATIRNIPGNRITLIQIADAPWLDMDVLQWSRHFRCFPGQGDFPLLDFMREVVKTGYHGYISHEIFNDEFRSSPCRPTAVDGMRSLLWLEEQLAGDEPDIAAPESTDASFLPTPSNIDQIEFIEFAVDGSSGKQLVGLIESLGFVKTHAHRSKDVGLYRMGDVSLVINEEPDSYAQHYFLLHGVSVCAVAYLCDDAEGMADRAAFYSYRLFEGDVESGELNIPGVKGIGGELIYFVQQQPGGRRFFDVDFVELNTALNARKDTWKSFQIDHVASGVSETEFLSTSLLYRVLFGLEIAQPQDLVDPYGIVVSRTATSKDKKIRLPFNMTRSWGASTERFRELHNGSGVQHIALRVDDILELVGLVDPAIVLSIPENYYDDLEARYELDHDLALSLRKYNLLYDQNETGYFIHFYTRSINGLFFEIVQRNKYGNYGEMNAQVRMAAQARLRNSIAENDSASFMK